MMTIIFMSIIFLSCIAIGWLFFLRRKKIIAPREKISTVKKFTPITITSKDIQSIAGENSIATQLDLARAYIESGRKSLAKKMLDHVKQQGTLMQQKEADRLLQLL